MSDLDLGRYSDSPLYNTKAVVQKTGLAAATLRAWERRYGVPEPDRSESNYRLYSERDIALLNWLRERTAEGLTIGQAVEMFRHESQRPQPVPRPAPATLPAAQVEGARDALIDAFMDYDEAAASQILNDLLARLSVEEVLMRIVQPTLIEVGERWHAGTLPVAVEHFGSSFVKRRLMLLINAQPLNAYAPLVILACAEREFHEIGPLLLTFTMRHRGIRVVYLGQNLPLSDLPELASSLHPAMIALSAMTEDALRAVVRAGEIIAALPEPRPLFAFGGGATARHPELTATVNGIHLGGDAVSAAEQALRILDGQ